ncbi:hypothetical protein IAT38_000089 [Cryptococcus sp. DSM 104549]
MASPNRASRMVLLPADYLASMAPSSEVTMQSLAEVSDRMADDAREAMPYNFDECSYSQGYLRQSVWSCLDCGGKGVCYGCSVSCHGDHKLVELWTKRAFRCDCPTACMQPEPVPPATRRRCKLNAPELQPEDPNHDNVYSKNFEGKFCRCGRDYDAETETEAMLCCIGCEDWLHETCLNLRQPLVAAADPIPTAKPSSAAATSDPSVSAPTDVPPSSSTPTNNDANEEEEEEDDEDVLIPSESYDGVICAQCVQSNPFLRSKAGSKGWMIIEPSEDGAWKVIGREEEVSVEVKEEGKEEIGDTVAGAKRIREEEDGEEASKKVKLDGEAPVEVAPQIQSMPEWKGKGDIFLANGIRESLKLTIDATTIASLPFPLEEEEAYEPPRDERPEESIDEVTNRLVNALPRAQAIEAVHAFQRLQQGLSGMLQNHVRDGSTVIRKEDIDELFEKLRRGGEVH